MQLREQHLEFVREHFRLLFASAFHPYGGILSLNASATASPDIENLNAFVGLCEYFALYVEVDDFQQRAIAVDVPNLRLRQRSEDLVELHQNGLVLFLDLLIGYLSGAPRLPSSGVAAL